MGIFSTSSPIPIRLFLAISLMGLLTACEIDDRVLCDDNEVSQNDTTHCPTDDNGIQSFKVHYTTANGNRPDGRYGFVPSGAAVTDAMAEAEAWTALQYTFNTTQAYVTFEAGEILHYRGQICGYGFSLRNGLGDFKVIAVRRTGAHTFDYDIELTCIY